MSTRQLSMKVLLVGGASSATLFAFVPLASALRNEGHDVLLATTEEMVPVAAQLGIPFVAVTERTLDSLLSTGRDGRPIDKPRGLAGETRFAGTWFGRLAAASIDGLREISRHWHPHLIIGGTSCYAAGLLAAERHIPHVRLAWDTLEATDTHRFADEELAPELGVLGLDHVPPPDLFLDVCPPSIRPSPAVHAAGLRWTPGNAQRKVEGWMLTKTERPRVVITSGSRLAVTGSHAFLRGLAGSVQDLGAEILVAAPESEADQLQRELPGLRVGWIPLDVIAPTCDLVVHHGGGVTALTAMSRGVPQVVLPTMDLFRDSWERLSDFGAGLTLALGAQSADDVSRACRDVLVEPSYRLHAEKLAAEIADLPGAAAHVRTLEQLVHA